MKKPFLSICVPSYNRPNELLRLLRTIDCAKDEVQIVICEDHAPKREEVRRNVETFKAETVYDVKYIENEVNKGYDWNIRDFLIHADGEYITYIGDDDGFVAGALDKLIAFLKEHRDLGYVLRRTQGKTVGNRPTEVMRYFPGTRFFPAGVETYQLLFRKSVIISGFTFKRELAVPKMTDRFDGSLLYQLYIMAEICLEHPSAYFDEALTQAMPGRTEFYFGSSEKEKGLYVPGKISAVGSMRFVSSFLTISRYIDQEHGLSSTKYVQKDLAKYAYPILEWVRQVGRVEMLRCAKIMHKEGMTCSFYFYVYLMGLLLFNGRFCRGIIRMIKRILGHTPSL